jgi:hypothetical protein
MKHPLLCLAACLTFSTTATAQSQLIVTHGPVSAPTYIDLGVPGDSIGDQRIWQFDGKTQDNQTVITDWVMTTTSQGALQSGMESRITLAVFSFGKLAENTILFQGIGSYPMAGSTLKSDAVLQRAIIGGTGKYAAAKGTVTSTHLPDNSWKHVVNLSK